MTRRTTNINAERVVVGSIIRSPHVYWSLSEAQVGAEHFSDKTTRQIFECSARLCEAGKTLTPQLLITSLPDHAPDGTSMAAQVAVLTKLAEDAGSALDYVDDLLEAFRWRKLEELASVLSDKHAEKTVDDLLAEIEAGVRGLETGLAKSIHPIPLADAADQAIRETAENYRSCGKGTAAGIRTGIRELDDMIGPLFPGNVVTIAGASGNGKTALLTQILFNASEPSLDLGSTRLGVLFCMEMRARELARRLLAQFTGISTREQREGANLSERDIECLQTTSRNLTNRLLLYDGGPMTMRELSRAIKVAKRRHGATIFGIDHLLEILPDNPRMSRLDVVPDAIGRLKELAQSEQVTIIALAQLTREFQKESGWRVRSQALWGGDAIKQRSDILLGVALPSLWLRENRVESGEKPHQKEAFDKWVREVEEWRGFAEIGTLKVRDGEAGDYRRVTYDGARLWFG
ncbi:MAG: AAA family ATPase [Candidatus Hydrogenedentes bacterium]|nr:AAA family ATPase [Candidatus Hydrogenedentota bacterium]